MASWNIQTYRGDVYFNSEVKMYDDIVRDGNVQLSINGIEMGMKTIQEDENKRIFIRDVQSLIICYLALEKVDQNHDSLDKYKKEIELLEQKAQTRFNGKPFSD